MSAFDIAFLIVAGVFSLAGFAAAGLAVIGWWQLSKTEPGESE